MMKIGIAVAVLAAVAPFAAADCPNACSGHGDCQSNWDFCQCYHGWLGADCSQRLCQFGLSFIDTPQGDLNHNNNLNDGFGDNSKTGASRPAGTPDSTALNPMWRFQGWWERHPAALYGTNDQSSLPFYVHPQEGHFYAECSNRGICNRESGLCECFTGYEGAACNRTVCTNDCSGHGTCETITEITPSQLYYRLWDADKTQHCVCDGGYFGMDCSQRQCMTNDDPLTLTTTRRDYNDGLTEQGEVQVIDIRCPFNGEMLDPMVSLTYTDDQFGDNYETARFNPSITNTANTDNVAALLKALPNQVLADFTIDQVTKVAKITEVSAQELETDNHYRWRVTFDSRMGDVPLLSGTPYFKCKGGAEVDWRKGMSGGAEVVWAENVAVTYLGDGPSEFLEFDFTAIVDNSGGSPDTYDYVVKNAAGDVFNGAASSTGNNFHDGSAALATASTFTREATKVQFEFSLGADSGSSSRDSNGAFSIKIHVDPVITVNNELFTLEDTPTSARTISALDIHTGGTGSTGPDIDFGFANNPTYDTKVEIIVTDPASPTKVGAWYINDEFIANVDLDDTSSDSLTTRSDVDGNALTLTSIPTNAASFVTTVDPASVVLGGSHYVFWLEKTPIVSSATGPETLTVSFTNYEPPATQVPVVIKITATSSNPDQYAWKIAGDPEWVYDSGTTGFNIPAGSEALGRVTYYLGDLYYPDDPLNLIRSNVDVIELTWSGGVDYDQRICEAMVGSLSTDNRYYIQIGTNGLNDAPECSDRGVCDYSTGTCKCFKGYAGIDCHLQNALSAGMSSQQA